MGEVRKAVLRQLDAWGRDDLGIGTELIVREPLTHAVRHAEGPYRVRLLRAHVLVCQVSDRGTTQPRPRRVARLAERRGGRYGRAGKTVRAGQPPAGR
ncbi:hypothetical protein [Streptomyces sp. URMC 129]|uniref:hypothetical protein n=1 Tax=Streptomyces sp. URMC 129 TaxID=3423407 RepID=UPI003F1CCDDC